MPKLKRAFLVIMVVPLIASAALVWLESLTSPPAKAATTVSNLPYNATANGPYHVQGNKILGADGRQYIIHGIGRDGLEYNCSGEGPLDQQHLAYMGSGNSSSTGTYWGANTIRLPLSENFWLYGAPGYPCTAAQYQATVKQVVDSITALKLNVILDLQWSNAGRQSGQGGGSWPMGDADSVTFWKQMASIYKGYSNVLFELFNEPHPPSWACWQKGCSVTSTNYSDDCQCGKTLTYQAVGMQALVDAVRGTGATNLVIVGGNGWGYDLSQVPGNPITGSNIVYSTHPYDYPEKQPANWNWDFGNFSASYPVISTEHGQYDCQSDYLDALYDYLDAHGIGWVAWAWVGQGDICGYPRLVSDYNGTPTQSMGQFVYQRLQSYNPVQPTPTPTTPSTTPTPTTPSPFIGPTNKTWYFAEGRVGAGYKEFLTLGNPASNADCPVTIRYLLEGGSAVTRHVTVARASRLTVSVNGDLGKPDTLPAAVSVSSVVTVDDSACGGIVAERPMYFVNETKSGSNVLGTTKLDKIFYFADVPTGPGYNSFLTILNPGTAPATVTAKYYDGGKIVGTQRITVPAGQRGTISPNGLKLPTHVAASVASSAAVAVERPSYFVNVSAGNAGKVTGAASVIGTSKIANTWLFAEGYTGGQFQEYLAIANVNTAGTATAAITLQFNDGTTKTYTVNVGAMDQIIWNVNQYAPGKEVSIKVDSSGAAIVVQRQKFFRYSHTAAPQLSNMGVTEVMGQIGPATATAYSFAEGYNNKGYNEWLTLQNPTNQDETIYLTLVNGYGRTYSPAGFSVKAHSRYTVDISVLVLNNLIRPGDAGRAYEVSMFVRTTQPGAAFVAERPMYFNDGRTQGGSDVIGYTGN